MAFYLIELTARWDLVITTGLAVWYIISPHIHSGYQACNGGLIHYYTIVSVDGKGLNTIIPNLLKVSEQ